MCFRPVRNGGNRPAAGCEGKPASSPVDEVQSAPVQQVSAYEVNLAMNTLRVSYGLPALIEDPIVNAVAQNTAAIMAANNMSWHIGDARPYRIRWVWRRRNGLGH